MPLSPLSSNALSFKSIQLNQTNTNSNNPKLLLNNNNQLGKILIPLLTLKNQNNQMNSNNNPYYTQRDPLFIPRTFSPSDSQKKLISLFNISRSSISTKANPFEIDPEDRIFDILRTKTKKKPKKPKKEPKHLRQSYSESKLSQIYKEHKNVALKLNQLKQQKMHFSLTNYQNRIIDVMSLSVSKDSIKKLIKRFYKIRDKCNKKYSSNLPILGELEETEEYIIDNANSQNHDIVELVKQMGKSKYGRKFQLKEIYFKNVINPKRPKIAQDNDQFEEYVIKPNMSKRPSESKSSVGVIKISPENNNKQNI